MIRAIVRATAYRPGGLTFRFVEGGQALDVSQFWPQLDNLLVDRGVTVIDYCQDGVDVECDLADAISANATITVVREVVVELSGRRVRLRLQDLPLHITGILTSQQYQQSLSGLLRQMPLDVAVTEVTIPIP